LTDGEQGADVVLGHDLHERVLHHLKAVQDVGCPSLPVLLDTE